MRIIQRIDYANDAEKNARFYKRQHEKHSCFLRRCGFRYFIFLSVLLRQNGLVDRRNLFNSGSCLLRNYELQLQNEKTIKRREACWKHVVSDKNIGCFDTIKEAESERSRMTENC